MLKIRRPLGRLIFNMGIAIPGKTVFLIETAPSHRRIGKSHHWFMVLLAWIGCCTCTNDRFAVIWVTMTALWRYCNGMSNHWSHTLLFQLNYGDVSVNSQPSAIWGSKHILCQYKTSLKYRLARGQVRTTRHQNRWCGWFLRSRYNKMQYNTAWYYKMML